MTIASRLGARGTRWALVMVAAFAVSMSSASVAQAEFGVTPGTFTAEVTSDTAHTPYTQGGGHPFGGSTSFKFNTHPESNGFWDTTAPDEDIRDIVVELPAGFVGNPKAAPTCDSTAKIIASAQQATQLCPADAQVGITRATFPGLFGPDPQTFTEPVFNIEPLPGDAATFAFSVLGVVIYIHATVRTDGDYGITTTIPRISEQVRLLKAELTLWGVPANPAHQAERGLTCSQLDNQPLYCLGGNVPTGAPQKAFLTNPSDCTAPPAVTSMTIDSWQQPGRWLTDTSTSPALTGCEKQTFNPAMVVRPDTQQPDTPTGLNVDLSFPQTGLLDPNGLASPPLKKAVVTLPEGMTINPAAAGGLTACSDAQLQLKSKADVTCPESAKVGTVTATTPLLDEAFTGGVYIRSQNSMDPESGEMFRIALVLENKERGISVRLPGSIRADKDTGRLVTTFDNNPQLPVESIKLAFKAGSRAPLATPATCGEKVANAQLTSWGGQVVDLESRFTIACAPDLGAFAPSFSAGTVSQGGGLSSPFALRIDKPDGQSDLNGLSLTLPPGLLATIKGNLGTQVGTARVAAGPGSSPFWLSGPVVLEGPYDDAPFSLRVTVPAQAGPFDLGDVVVRQKLYVDKHDAHVTVVSDPLPTIVKGVPVRLQSLAVDVDKPGFMRNPTNCSPMTVTGQLQAATGQSAGVSSRFQAADCAALPFDPVFSARSNGKLTFKKGASLNVHMAVPDGDANIASVETTLPKELPSRLIPTIRNACVMEQYLADFTKCPEQSYIGTVSAVTPLLEEPLTGPAYIVAPPNDVPRVELKLFGQGTSEGVQVDLEGDVIVDIGDGRSRVSFKMVPDVPVTSFDVDFPAGDHSILDAPSYDTCKGPIQILTRIVGQNGKVSQGYKTVKVTNCPKFGEAKVTKVKTTTTGISLRIKPPVGDGRMTVSGSGLTPVVRKVDRRWTYSVKVPLSAAGKRAISRKGSLKTRLTVLFKPTNSPKSSTVKTKTITVKTKKAGKGKSSRRTIISRTLW